MSKARPMVTPVVTLTRAQHVRDHPLAGHHREDDADARVTARSTFRVPLEATQARDQGRRRRPVQGQGDGGQHAAPGRQEEGLPGPSRAAHATAKKAIVTLAEGHTDRRDDGSLGWHGAENLTNRPRRRQRQLVIVDRSEPVQGRAGQDADRGHAFKSGGRNNYGRITVRWRGGGHKRTATGSSTSGAASSTCRRRSSGWNTIRTARLSSPSITLRRTASWPTSWRRSA